MKKSALIETLFDIIYSVVAGIVVACGLYFFANSNDFAPGGITGIASFIAHFTPNVNMAYYMLAFNIPLFVLCSIFVEKKLGIYMSIYLSVQSLTLILLEFFKAPAFVADDGTLIFASIATGVVTGIGFSIQLRRHGASGGTYAISALIKRKNPATNIAWLTFVMDSLVVFLIVIFYGENAVLKGMCTLINLFIANIVVDYCLQGVKEGYKFEIITDEPEELAQELMAELKHGVTEMAVHGMYTHKERFMIVCIIRKRELSKMMRILKRYPKTFANFVRVNEVFGNFK
ncbi:MAG: YitT family protein [Clostridia bacterium]|nr:YitT family protein [Clostridia bacterium]